MQHVTAPPSDASLCPLSSSSMFGLGGLGGGFGSRAAPPPSQTVAPTPELDHEEAQEVERDRGRTLPEFHEWKRKETLKGAYGPDVEHYPQETLEEICREFNVSGLEIKLFPGVLFDPENETASMAFEVGVPPSGVSSPRRRDSVVTRVCLKHHTWHAANLCAPNFANLYYSTRCVLGG